MAKLLCSFLAIAASLAMVASCPGRAMHHSISVSLFPPDKSLLAVDSVYVGPEDLDHGRIKFLINRSLSVESISANAEIDRWYTEEDLDASTFKDAPDSEDIELVKRGKGIFIEFAPAPPPDIIAISINYAGVIYDSLRAPAKAYAKGFGSTTGLIEERGVFLTNESLWYPFQFARMFTFSLKVDVPYDWMAVSQGHLLAEYAGRLRDEDRVFDIWIEESPTPECYLIAGEYYRHQARHDGTWIMIYTYEQSDSLSQVYIEATKRYISMYERLIGDYPYPKFALVENFWQTGFGMPSFTLLGSRVIRLPFIVHTSYGHEILHNWWGNSVYVDYNGGNWCEGLTTYGADYLYKEQMGEEKARDYRHHTLIAFNNYVTEEKDFPLSEFRERHDASSQSVGYGKSLMTFHMLRKSLGDSIFWRGLREFYTRSRFVLASWRDIESAFSEVSGKDLSWYFDQWVNRTGAPSIRLAHTDYTKREADYLVTFTLEQDSLPFIVDMPVRIETTHGDEDLVVRLRGQDSTYSVSTRAEPVSIAVDPDYNTFRRLYIEEIPITLGSLFGEDSALVVIGSEEDDSTRAYLRDVADLWGLGDRTFDEAEFDQTRIRTEPLWLLGRGNTLKRLLSLSQDRIEVSEEQAKIAGSEFSLPGNTLVCALRNPYNDEIGFAVVLSQDLQSLRSLAQRIPHYSAYSYLGFQGGRPILKGVWEERRSPLTVEFGER